MKNPFLNALAAEAYIGLIALSAFYVPKGFDNTVVAPVAMISLLTFSVAVMGYLFVWPPLKLYIDGEKKKAVSVFFQTLAYFALITLVLVAVSYLASALA